MTDKEPKATSGSEKMQHTSSSTSSGSYQLLKDILGQVATENESDIDPSIQLGATGMDSPLRSAESREFVTKFVLGPISGSNGPLDPSNPIQIDAPGIAEDNNDDEELDMDAYTLQIRGEIIDFFVSAAERVNDLIDAKAANPPETEEQERLADAEVEAQVQRNKKAYDAVYRHKIAEYMTLIQETIRTLQDEEEQLLKFCSNMYPNTCE